MTRLLAEMQTTIFHAALPLFGGSVVRFGLFVLVQRQSLRGQAISVHALAQSLGQPFETCRRQIGTLIEDGLCARTKDGVVAVAPGDDSPVRGLTVLAHDCFVRFVEDFAPFLSPIDWVASSTPYDWSDGVQAAADLMLAVATGNSGTHQDWTDLVIFSAILCANYRAITRDPVLAQRYRGIDPRPPSTLIAPVHSTKVAAALAMPLSTVRRRLAHQRGGAVESSRNGFTISTAWFDSEPAIQTSVASYANVRRLLGSLARKGFPFDDIASAYVHGRPAAANFD